MSDTPRTDAAEFSVDSGATGVLTVVRSHEMETPMSTPTPRTDAAQFDATQVSEEGGVYLVVGVDLARTLETELTAANARIAELEKENDEVETQLSDARNGWESALTKVDDVSRQLSEAQVRIEALTCDSQNLNTAEEELARLSEELSETKTQRDYWHDMHAVSEKRVVELESQLINAKAQLSASQRQGRSSSARVSSEISKRFFGEDLSPDRLESLCLALIGPITNERDNLSTQLSESQAQLESSRTARSEQEAELCKALKDYETQVENLEAQLASAREDSARLDWMNKHAASVSVPDEEPLSCLIQAADDFELKGFAERYDLRSAIDSARGATSPPAVAETGEKDAWQDIATAPKDGTRVLLYGVEKPGEAYHLFEGWFDKEWWATFGNDDVHNVSHWQPLPPPPQGKETK